MKPPHVGTRRDGFYVLLTQGGHPFPVPLGGVQAFFASSALFVQHPPDRAPAHDLPAFSLQLG